MRVIHFTAYAKGYVSKITLTGNGSVYVNKVHHPQASWSISGENEEDLNITFSYIPDNAGYLHEFKLIDSESGLYHLMTKGGDSVPNEWHKHRLILIRNRSISARNLVTHPEHYGASSSDA